MSLNSLSTTGEVTSFSGQCKTFFKKWLRSLLLKNPSKSWSITRKASSAVKLLLSTHTWICLIISTYTLKLSYNFSSTSLVKLIFICSKNYFKSIIPMLVLSMKLKNPYFASSESCKYFSMPLLHSSMHKKPSLFLSIDLKASSKETP